MTTRLWNGLQNCERGGFAYSKEVKHEKVGRVGLDSLR